jgi:hypothetical protein
MTRRGRFVLVTAILVVAFLVGLEPWLWNALPWAVK